MKNIIIKGWHINLDHDHVKAKTLKELKIQNIFFTNLNDEEKESAYNELWEVLHPSRKNNQETE
jgi:hypothetical protein